MTMGKQEFLVSSGLAIERLEFCLEQRWLVPAQGKAGAEFSEIEIARARLIRELGEDLGSNDAGIDIILHLLDQLHEMRRAFGELRTQIRPGSAE